MKRSTKNGEFPVDGQYVLGKLIDDCGIGEDNRLFFVVRFCIGRESHEITGGIYRFADQYGNNLVPWRWDTFGPMDFFGQNIEEWWDLKEITK